MSRHLSLTLLQYFAFLLLFDGCLMADDSSTMCDCNCDVQIDVVRNVMKQLAASREQGNKLSTEISDLKRQLSENSNKKLVPRNCMEAAAGSLKSGVYKLHLERISDTPFEVFCNEEPDFGGWLVIQRRISGSVDFHRGWQAYKDSFGDLAGNYWIGLEKLHALTSSCEQELYIEFERFNGTTRYAKYTEFVIGSESEDYALKKLGNFTGNEVDALKSHIGMKFSTYDRNNDVSGDYNCAKHWEGGWWFHSCFYSYLNGKYTKDSLEGGWLTDEINKKIKFVQMMIRPTEKCLRRLSLRN